MRWKRCGARISTPSRCRTAERVRVHAVGRLRPGPERDLFDRFNARLRPPIAVVEVAEGIGAVVEIKRREARALLASLPADALVVALDEGGRVLDSLGFAQALQTWIETARPICFVIGGAEGLDAAVLARAEAALSLGAMTWPHFLVRGMLAEQIFRAKAILGGHPYHRSGRP